jgi:dTDP-D-glucose 4,6-dehydratase
LKQDGGIFHCCISLTKKETQQKTDNYIHIVTKEVYGRISGKLKMSVGYGNPESQPWGE